MARVFFSFGTDGVKVALVAATAKTVLQCLTPANRRIDWRSLEVMFDGITANNVPVLIEVLKQTTSGTMTSTTPVHDIPKAETIQTSTFKNATAEPTPSTILKEYLIHPQNGMVEKFTDEFEVEGNVRVGVRMTAPQGVNVIARIHAEE